MPMIITHGITKFGGNTRSTLANPYLPL